MKEGDIFESFLDGAEYVVKNIVSNMVVLQSRKGDRQILTAAKTVKKTIVSGRRKRGLTNDEREGMEQSLRLW